MAQKLIYCGSDIILPPIGKGKLLNLAGLKSHEATSKAFQFKSNKSQVKVDPHDLALHSTHHDTATTVCLSFDELHFRDALNSELLAIVKTEPKGYQDCILRAFFSSNIALSTQLLANYRKQNLSSGLCTFDADSVI